MVKGLELFREYFRDFAGHYMLIGGAACDLIMDDAGLSFRATKDLDVVLCLEATDSTFAEAFWAFVTSGGYRLQETTAGKKILYRFARPTEGEYPALIELFSRLPDALSMAGKGHLTPIPFDGVASSLSAILLDDAYYHGIRSGRREIKGVPVVGPEHLIPLKAKAWLDLRARADAGDRIDRRTITKHRNDVFRLFQVIAPDARPNPPATIAGDMRVFVDLVKSEEINMKAMGLGSRSMNDVIDALQTAYRIA